MPPAMRHKNVRTNIHQFFRLASSISLAVAVFSSTSCTTTYDAYGRPQQSVDPGLVVVGLAAAGILGYAIAENNGHHYSNNYYHGNSNYHGGGYYGGYHGGH